MHIFCQVHPLLRYVLTVIMLKHTTTQNATAAAWESNHVRTPSSVNTYSHVHSKKPSCICIITVYIWYALIDYNVKNGCNNIYVYRRKLSWQIASSFRTASTRQWVNVESMLGQRRRRWSNINRTLGYRLVFSWRLKSHREITGNV